MTNTMNAGADGIATIDTMTKRGVANPAMFFRRWLANPLQMGSVVPSSAALCQRIVQHARRVADEAVLELGAGTGVDLAGAAGWWRPTGAADRGRNRTGDGGPSAQRAPRRAGDRGRCTEAARPAASPLARPDRQRDMRHSAGAAAAGASSGGSSPRSRRWLRVAASSTTAIAPPRRCPGASTR